MRALPLIISVQSVSNPQPSQTPVKGGIRRKGQSVAVVPVSSPSMTLVTDNSDSCPVSPASPILKAQLSAPSKTREPNVVTPASKGDTKSQVIFSLVPLLFVGCAGGVALGLDLQAALFLFSYLDNI